MLLLTFNPHRRTFIKCLDIIVIYCVAKHATFAVDRKIAIGGASAGNDCVEALSARGTSSTKNQNQARACPMCRPDAAVPVDLRGMRVKAKAPEPPPSPWDFAFGSALMSDYNFSITQSNHKPSAAAY
jgi:hypothetical protein